MSKKELELNVTQVPKTAEEQKLTLNPYVPLYIAKAPWYELLNKPKEYKLNGPEGLENWYSRGKKAGKKVTKYRKGACANCGAMTHSQKDCVERPRKKGVSTLIIGAKWTGEDIQQDEIVQKIELDFEGKRDRWNGYDPSSQLEEIEKWKIVEEKRLEKRKEKRLEKQKERELKRLENPNEISSDDSDEDKYADDVDVVGQNVDTKERVTVRNLRIREDTAKYLINLDPNSANYDPKTRSMRENPHVGKNLKTLPLYRGDDFERYTGAVYESTKMNEFAWDAEQKGPQNTVHSNPTEGELLYKKQKQSEGIKSVVKKSILDKYGGSEYLESIPKELLLSQTEEYIEYSSSGDILKGEQKKLKSKYPEDILLHNHLSVWGSYWKDGKWGYKCCHSYLKNSYCGGINSLEAEESQNFLKPIATGRGKSLVDIHIESKSTSKQQKPSFKRPGEGEFEVDQEKLKNAMAEEMKRKRIDDGTTKSFSGTLTEEEMEAYRLTKVRKDDPMAGYKDKFDK